MGWGYLKHRSNGDDEHEDGWSSLAGSRAGCADHNTGCGARLQVVSGHGGKDCLTHLLLLRFVHILEINNPSAPIATALRAKLCKSSAKLLVLLLHVYDTREVRAFGADDLLVLHPGVRATAAKALQQQTLAVFATSVLVTGKCLLGLTRKGRDFPSANDIGIEALAKHATGNVLHLLDLVLRRLGSGKDERKLGVLISASEVVDSGVVGIEATEWAKDTLIKALNELVAYADGIGVLSSKWPQSIQHTLVILDGGSGKELAIWVIQ